MTRETSRQTITPYAALNAAPATPIVHCRACNRPMRYDVWAGQRYDLVTCSTSGCKLRDFTFTTDSYATVDLSRYGCKEHPEWTAVLEQGEQS